MKRRIAILLGALLAIQFAGTGAALAEDLVIPIDRIVFAPEGSLTELGRTEVPENLVGSSCLALAVAENQGSVHPGNDLIIESDGSSATLEDVERAPGAITEASGPITLGEDIVITLRMGPDEVFSAAVVVIVTEECTPPTTSTTSTSSTTTSSTSSTTTTLITPEIGITKSPDQEVSPEGVATFEIVVTNTGPEDLENVRVTDDVALEIDPASNCPNPDVPDLAVGESYEYTCTVAGFAIADLPWVNTAVAIGVGVTSQIEVTATDSATVVGVANTTITQPPTTTEAPTTTQAPTTTGTPTETLPNTGPGDEVRGFATVGAIFFLAGAALLGGAALIGRLREE